MIVLIIFLTCVLVAGAFGVMAGVSDYRGMTIPNLYSLVIFGAFVPCCGVLLIAGQGDVFAPLLSHILGFAVVFGVTFAMFTMGLWGGGDQKLMSAFAVWFGFGGLPVFLIYTTIFGGVVGVIALLLKRFKPVKNPPEGGWVAQVQAGENKVPYGIAIAAGALLSFVKLGYLNIDTMRAFL